MPNYLPSPSRYDGGSMHYRRCGRSGVLLPEVSLGLWHNFGGTDPFEKCRAIARCAFDHGITHFDLANNYGPPYGSAEQTMGRLLHDDFRPYRDELFISTKAGYDMWPGPYGNWGSRKYLMASLDQSLSRMGIDYVDLFYSHRYDPETPLEETLQALVDTVRAGKALYIGISRWPLHALKVAVKYLREHDTPLLIYQGRLNLLDRAPQEEGITDLCAAEGVGFISFPPAQPQRRRHRARRDAGRDGAGVDTAPEGGHLGARRRKQRGAVAEKPEVHHGRAFRGRRVSGWARRPVPQRKTTRSATQDGLPRSGKRQAIKKRPAA